MLLHELSIQLDLNAPTRTYDVTIVGEPRRQGSESTHFRLELDDNCTWKAFFLAGYTNTPVYAEGTIIRVITKPNFVEVIRGWDKGLYSLIYEITSKANLGMDNPHWPIGEWN